ncbi:MAG: hydrogenase maturation protease [Bdellovibrionales bacterium]|nr:hydrogenase maturation protease [Bdellovibrionales bacterium]
MTTPLQIIGIGNPMRGDDALGWQVVEQLREMFPEVPMLTCDGEATRLLQYFEQSNEVILIDCVHSGAPAGKMFRLEGEQIRGESFRTSTHTFGLEQAIELAISLKKLPRTLLFFGVEGAQFDWGAPLSEAVSRTMETLISELAKEILRNDGGIHGYARTVPN